MKYSLCLLILATVLTACTGGRLSPSPHASYHEALVRENMQASAARWAAEAAASLHAPMEVELPYAERRLLEPGYLQPVTVAVDLQTDQQLNIDITPSPNTRAEVFVDVFAVTNSAAPKRIASMPAKEHRLSLSVDYDGTYLVRIQPSHTATGLIDTAISTPARFEFPVDVQHDRAVQSFFGVARDAGRRKHEGIDVFAPRGTPVLSATPGRVTRVGETPRGGKQVWVRHDGRSFYYAHLDSIAVTSGETVAPGQTLGTVGNTGNARTTPPHLHFGVYKRGRGAIDPLPLVGRGPSKPLQVARVEPLSPRWMSVAANKLNVRTGPSTRYRTALALTRGELVRVDAVAGDWLRVTTGSGAIGFIARQLTAEPAEVPLELNQDRSVASRPHKDAPVIGAFSGGERVTTYGRFGEFTLVKLPGGVQGWTQAAVEVATGDAS